MPLLVGCHSITPTRLLWPYSSSTASVMLRLSPPSGISHTRTCHHVHINALSEKGTRLYRTGMKQKEAFSSFLFSVCCELHQELLQSAGHGERSPRWKTAHGIHAAHCVGIRRDYGQWLHVGPEEIKLQPVKVLHGTQCSTMMPVGVANATSAPVSYMSHRSSCNRRAGSMTTGRGLLTEVSSEQDAMMFSKKGFHLISSTLPWWPHTFGQWESSRPDWNRAIEVVLVCIYCTFSVLYI